MYVYVCMCVSVSYQDRFEHINCCHLCICVWIIHFDYYQEWFKWMKHTSPSFGLACYSVTPLNRSIHKSWRQTHYAMHYGQMEAQPAYAHSYACASSVLITTRAGVIHTHHAYLYPTVVCITKISGWYTPRNILWCITLVRNYFLSWPI